MSILGLVCNIKLISFVFLNIIYACIVIVFLLCQTAVKVVSAHGLCKKRVHYNCNCAIAQGIFIQVKL